MWGTLTKEAVISIGWWFYHTGVYCCGCWEAVWAVCSSAGEELVWVGGVSVKGGWGKLLGYVSPTGCNGGILFLLPCINVSCWYSSYVLSGDPLCHVVGFVLAVCRLWVGLPVCCLREIVGTWFWWTLFSVVVTKLCVLVYRLFAEALNRAWLLILVCYGGALNYGYRKRGCVSFVLRLGKSRPIILPWLARASRLPRFPPSFFWEILWGVYNFWIWKKKKKKKTNFTTLPLIPVLQQGYLTNFNSSYIYV